MQPDAIKEPTLRADIVAVADLIEATLDSDREFSPEGMRFIVTTLRQLAANAGLCELALASRERRLAAAAARIEALTIPDYLKETRVNIAVREGRAAGVVIDLRAVFAREQDKAAGLRDATSRAAEFAGESA